MTTSEPVEIDLAGDAATRALGERLGRSFAGGLTLALSGELGAGKTTLVKGLARGLGVADPRDVTSPTFLRVVRFEAAAHGAFGLVHVDAYRMSHADELVELGLAEDLAGRDLVAIEWPEHVAAGLPRDHLRVELDHVDEAHRRARLVALGVRSRAWLDAAESLA